MDRVFEDEFMEAQSRIVALCVEFAGNRADKVYAYGSIEESSISFNAFFNIDGQIKTTNNISADPDAIWDLSGKIDTEYKYESICSAKTGTDSSEIFMKWLDEVLRSTDRENSGV